MYSKEFKEECKKKFKSKLNDSFLEEYEQGTLLTKGRKFKLENKNGVFDIEILSLSDEINIEFEFIDEGYSEIWTIDNFYIIDDIHLESLFNNAKKYNIDSSFPQWEGVYILCDNENNKYYIGLSKNINKRIKNHLSCNKSDIDKRLHETKNFTLKCIKLKESGYSNLDALESAFIAYLSIESELYNKTRGNNTAPQNAKSSEK